MHRKFDQYKKPCCKGHFPVYSLSSVIRKVSNNSVAGCPPCKAFFSQNESCAQNRSLGWSSAKRESSEMGAVAFVLLCLHLTLSDWLSQLYSLIRLCHQPEGQERAWAVDDWMDLLQVLECQTSKS